MGIYRQRVGHKSNTALLEAKMLLLSFLLVSCCLPGSMGDAVREFQANLKALLALTNKETWIQVPSGKFQYNDVPCQLKRTIKGLKVSFKNEQMRTRIALLEKNMNHIISAVNKGLTEPEENRSCLMTEVPQQRVLKCFRKYFQKLCENCSQCC